MIEFGLPYKSIKEKEKMKKSIMFNLVLFALFVFGQNLFAIEGAPETDILEPDEEGILLPRGPRGDFNTFYGSGTGDHNTEGSNNAFFGYAAGYENTIGNDNSFFGWEAGCKNTEGDGNSFFGSGAGFFNTAGKKIPFSDLVLV